MIAPAARSFAAMAESRGTFAPSNDQEPAGYIVLANLYLERDASATDYAPVVFILSNVAILFLINIGTPWRGLTMLDSACRYHGN